MTQKFLRESDDLEAMRVFYGPDPEPHTHTVWTGDFMGMCKHDIACPVCFDASAVIHRNVDPGRWSQSVGPCRDCEAKGWRIARLPKWVRGMLRL